MKSLPPGQKESKLFPRFGLPQYAHRFPSEIDKIKISIAGDLEEFDIVEDFNSLNRINQVSDFHCVTTWSKISLNWSGYRFSEFFNKLILPKLSSDISFVVLKAQDGFKTSLPLGDLLADNVMLADRLDDQPLTIEHGAPIRIVAPNHYGYKNPKHVNRIEFYTKKHDIKKGLWKFIDHPRARVAYEERARKGPKFFFRWLYKFGVNGTIKDFEKAMAKYRERL